MKVSPAFGPLTANAYCERRRAWPWSQRLPWKPGGGAWKPQHTDSVTEAIRRPGGMRACPAREG